MSRSRGKLSIFFPDFWWETCPGLAVTLGFFLPLCHYLLYYIILKTWGFVLHPIYASQLIFTPVVAHTGTQIQMFYNYAVILPLGLSWRKCRCGHRHVLELINTSKQLARLQLVYELTRQNGQCFCKQILAGLQICFPFFLPEMYFINFCPFPTLHS